ncbi:glucosylglycerol-phosphate synthase [Pedomonas mirosovicensis]|uniref:glucosylglycerol-phosphate synthase n=1 Tax=Pedomonas mirosovicensis TaxID=2908641 RepID=UPI002167427F|nr:glucosylglycerol-phosphate synthase [Pedomonas mirosovicensis]MCH8685689.1 glucosylglycerol-phosphate synthase [Pedomonas mirosovicensis]
MSSLVIVYHRQPYEEEVVEGRVVYRENKSPNGIVPTLKGFFGQVRKGTWVAWKSAPQPGEADFERRITIEDSYGTYDVARLPLSREQISQFYHITSKEALWPILHSFPTMFNTERCDWQVFREVNRLFAEAACEEADDDAIIWVHDYNLWLVPHFVRQMRPNARVAFFHHTPFPSPDIFAILPWRDEILDSLLACDLVGFHVPRYARNFAATVEALRPGAEVANAPAPSVPGDKGTALTEPTTPTHVRVGERRVMIDAFPIGTNPQLIHSHLATAKAKDTVAKIREEFSGQKLILSVGRVDYTKGTFEMLATFERLLERRPELIGKVKLMVTSVAAARGMQVYQEAQDKIEQAVGRINGRFGRLGWTPIVLSTRGMPFEEVVCYYRAADICWVTPLRDGLNLVAKEYVAAHEGKDGVLVLSEFTGVAAELHEAVLTNPYSLNIMDRAIDDALAMPPEEQRQRMRALYERVISCDIGHWTRHVMGSFRALDEAQDQAEPVRGAA